MKDKDRAFEIRKNMIDDWRFRRMHWKDITYKYRVSKEWFYSLRKRFLKKGYEGLRDKVPDYSNRSRRSSRIGLEEKLEILNYIYQYPTHGPDRIGSEMVPRISHSTLWRFLAKDRHVESSRPGELISIDTLTVSVKGLGKIWQYTACDTYSSYGWAWAYYGKTSDNAVDFFMNHILTAVPTGKIKRILTDQGTEFFNIKRTQYDSPFTNALRAHSIRHTVTKVAHPWTNGYVERLNQTIWQEFYLCRLEHPYASMEALNKELYAFMRYYNFNRVHSGYKLKKEGYEFPGHAFFDVRESRNIIEIKY